MSEPAVNRMPPVALLAGGLATRLRPITITIPKAMLMVADEPFITHQLRLLRREMITDVVICCGYLGEQIEAFVGDGSRFGCNVRYSYDGDVLKGTGGALRQAMPLLGREFFVMYGDSYLPTSFVSVYDAYAKSGMLGLMTVFHNENRWDKSNVEFRDGIIARYDKRTITPDMHYIDYGLGLIREEAFDTWRDVEVFDLASVYQRLVEQGRLAGHEISERFYEIGSREGLEETDALLRANRPNVEREK
jgi:NDP-sugar pyrophosphorylase family protein